jgi:dTDP-3-amino-3,4,6-trideoxy-alpha-D-glucose transaminase
MTANVLMNDFRAQWADIGADAHAALSAVGESGWYVLGARVTEFERALAGAIGVPHIVGCGSGLDGLEIALRATGLAPGDRVITTPLSAFATTLAIVRAGGVPVFVDVDESGLLDLNAVAGLLARDAGIRHLLPVHLYGHALDLRRLERLKREHKLWVVEDVAQALGARSYVSPVGSVGQIAATSFYPTKNLGALGDAGAVLTSDPELAARARQLRDYGQTAKYRHDVIGMNSRLDELHAAILSRALLPRWAEWSARRRTIADRYLQELQHPQVTPLPIPAGSESVWHLFPVRVPSKQRSGLMAHLEAHGIQSAVHYPTPIHEQRALASVPFVVHGSLERARALCQAELSLPIHPYMTDAQVSSVITAVNAWRST